MKNIDFLVEKIIAHRGIHYRYKENTIGAFRTAMIRGYPIELDVQLTKDKKMVVYHDSNLKRLTGINKDVNELTYQEIKNIIDVPVLEDVLKLVKGRVSLIVELKSVRKDFLLERMTSSILDNYKGCFAIQSFNPMTLWWFRMNRKNYIRGYLVNSVFPKNFLMKLLLNNRLLNVILKPDYIGVNIKYITNQKIIKLRSKYIIIGYTINSLYEYNKYKEYGDNFICNIGKEPIVRVLNR